MGGKSHSGNKLTEEEVLHVAELANLKLNDEEVRKFSKQLTEILSYVSELSKVDTSGEIPAGEVTVPTGRLREDEETGASLTIEEVTSGTKAIENGCFVVGGILNKDS